MYRGRLAGLARACVGIEICRPDGEMARVPDLEKFCAQHDLKMCSIAAIIERRLARESLVKRLAPAQGTPVRTPEGAFNLIAFQSVVDPLPHLALTVGGVGELGPDGTVVEQTEPTLVRMHRRNLLGDIFSDLDASSDGPTSDPLRPSMPLFQRGWRGAIVTAWRVPRGQAGWLLLSLVALVVGAGAVMLTDHIHTLRVIAAG